MAELKRPRVLLAIPGPDVKGAVVQAIIRTLTEARDFEIQPINFAGSIGWLNFNQAWAQGLKAAKRGGYSHFAMLHADVDPAAQWLNRGMAALARYPELGLVSFPVEIKDERGLVSCGAGITSNQWWPYRRLTNFELQRLPKVARLDDLMALWKCQRRDGLHLIHNNGCWVADLRKPEWWKRVENGWGGEGIPCFTFPAKIEDSIGEDGEPDAKVVCNPEDFTFSRMAHLAGIQSAIITDSPTAHIAGHIIFRSHFICRAGQPGGMWKFDHEVGHPDAHSEEERQQLANERAWLTGWADENEPVKVAA